MGNQKQDYIIQADILRIIAIFGAVSIHIVQPFYGRWDFIGGKVWWLTDIWNAFSRISIPLFILVSGYFILNKEESIQQTWKRSVKRLIIPLVVWSFLYHIWNYSYLHKHVAWQELALSFFHGGLYHYYFLGILVGLYAVTPFVRYILNTGSKSLVKYLLLLSLIGSLLLNVYLYITYKTFSTNVFTYWVQYLGYFILGGLIARNKVQIKNSLLIIVFILYWILTTLMGWVNLNLLQYNTPLLFPPGALSHFFDYYLSPNVAIMSISIFILVLNLPDRLFIYQNSIKTVIKSLSKASFGMYLIHPFIIDYIHNTFLIHVTNLPIHLCIKSLSVFTLSYVSTYYLLKIPGIRRIIGT